MKPYYVLKKTKFNELLLERSSNTQIDIIDEKYKDPFSSFNRNSMGDLESYVRYDFKTEKKKNQLCRRVGDPEPYEEFIEIFQNCFYLPKLYHDIIIIDAPRQVYQSLLHDFKRDEEFQFEKIAVDFDYIITENSNLGVQAIWLGGLKDANLNTVQLYGNNVNHSLDYQQYLLNGAEIKNLTIFYEYKESQYKIMITRDGGVILFKAPPSDMDALDLICDVNLKLFKSNS